MQIVIEKEALEKMLTISLYAITGADYDDVKASVDELLGKVGYTELPKGHGRLIDADELDKKRIDYIVDGYANDPEDCSAFGLMIIVAPTIIPVDKEEVNEQS